jgi:hypothetical protein
MAKTLTVYLAADLKKFNSGMDQAGKKVNGFSGSLKNKLGPALIAAGAAAGAFALKLAKDGVQAAIEDEKAVAQLANTLTNLNLAHDTQAVEDYIYQLERAYGVADTELRPAYERLVRSTQDTEEANRALQIAMDVAAGTGQSLKTVTDSLGRAFDGQTSTLARLGTGIDKTTLATASMDDILNQLSANFSGAADAAANTFEGRMDRLKTATDNLAEAFGAGLLDSLNDATEGTQNAVDAMEDLEPLLKSVGKAVGDNVADIAYLAGVMTDLADGADNVAKNLGPLEYAWDSFVSNLGTGTIGLAADAIRELRGETNRLVGLIGGGDFDSAYEDSNFQIQAANSIYRDAAVRIDRINTELEEQAAQKERETKLYKAGAGAVEQYTKEQQKLLDTSELLGISLATTRDELIGSIGDLEAATAAVEAYADSIQQDLLGGINLGQLYQDNFDEQGRQTGKSLIDGFQEQVNQAEWFGNVLTAIKAQGADQSLIEQIASLGPEVGGALGQQLLNEGIVPTLNEQWVNVQDTTKELALGLVPEFLEAGRLSAIENLNGLAEQFKKDQRKFKKLGRAIGEQVGASFKKQIAKDVADAVRAVEAAATAARAERVAAAEAEQARITEQAVATAISNLIRNSDQRSGRNVQPVLQ